MSSERSLIVRGIPASWTADDVELFFDNDNYCPGGCVEKVELSAGEVTASATVTFTDMHGSYSFACRLILCHF